MVKRRRRKKKKNKALKGSVQLTGSAILAQQAVRSGLPRAVGVQLETHSTNRSAAKSILKNGLDPSFGGAGEKGISGFDGALKNATPEEAAKIRAKMKASENKVFVTGFHPDQNVGGVKSSVRRRGIRNLYRGLGTSGKKEWDLIGQLDVSIGDNLRAGKIKAATRETAKALKNKDTRTTMAGVGLNSLPGINAIKGKSLYHGGSTSYFRENFESDPGLPGAMMTGLKLDMSSTRLGATKAAIKREGLGNLVKGNKSRVAAGVGITAAGGVAAGYLAKEGLSNVSNRSTAKRRKPKTKKRLTALHKSRIGRSKKGKKIKNR